MVAAKRTAEGLTSVLGEHRFHSHMWMITMHYAIHTRAKSTLDNRWSDGQPIRLPCNTSDNDLRMVFNETLDRAQVGMWPNSIFWALTDRRYQREEISVGDEKTPNTFSMFVVQAIFALACELAIEWTKKRESNFHLWPPVVGFCRIVRNAIVHNGLIDINSPNSPTGSWNGLSYTYNENCRDIRKDLTSADLISLLFDLDEELDQHDAPINLAATAA